MKDKLIAAIREVPISKTYEEYVVALADRLNEVVEEIFEEIEKQSYYMDTGFGDEAEVIACDDIAKLKKKYIGEDINVTTKESEKYNG